MKVASRIALVLLLVCSAGRSWAGPDWQSGHLSNVAFAGDEVLVMMDSGLPNNCAGTPYGWMLIPASDKVTKAFVLALWLRGDSAQTTLTIYTTAYTGSGYCVVTQIDPAG